MTHLPPALSLETVAEAFAAWRRDRRGRQVPTALRRQVVALLEAYSISQVIDTLALNHQTVKRWQRDLGQIPTSETEPALVPLTTPAPAPVAPHTPTPPALTLSWSGPDGEYHLSGQLAAA